MNFEARIIKDPCEKLLISSLPDTWRLEVSDLPTTCSMVWINLYHTKYPLVTRICLRKLCMMHTWSTWKLAQVDWRNWGVPWHRSTGKSRRSPPDKQLAQQKVSNIGERGEQNSYTTRLLECHFYCTGIILQLVVGFKHFLFSIIYGIILPID